MMGISGNIARFSQNNPITPIIAVMIVILGVIAIFITPKEEDPQIDVTMVDIFLAAPGYSAREVENKIVAKAENAMAQIAGVEHVYSTSMSDSAVVSVQFEVGIKRQEALVKSWNQIKTELHWEPSMNIHEPLVRARGINDVPILSLTLVSQDGQKNQTQLAHIAYTLGQLLQRVAGSRNIEVIGGNQQIVEVAIEPELAASYQINVGDVVQSMRQFSKRIKEVSTQRNQQQLSVELGNTFRSIDDVKQLVISAKDGQIIYLEDISRISLKDAKPTNYVQYLKAQVKPNNDAVVSVASTAVTIAVSKQEGQNAIDVANAIIESVENLKGRVIPDDVSVIVTRNSGLTAEQKANTLIQKLLFATLAVVVLVYLALGKRAALIVGVAVGLTLLITLFSSWAWGFTLNRISLFALIFSIGILVDDAIVVVENIHRRQQLFPNESMLELVPKAIDEVGSSTILATFTVMAALIPMAFVSGLMGPYMSPIPINASTGMLLSLIIAFTITPWLAVRWFKRSPTEGSNSHVESEDKIGQFTSSILAYFVAHKKALRNQWLLFIGIVASLILVMMLPVTGQVLLKMLPFDNKSSFSIVVDTPEGTTVENTLGVLQQLATPLLEDKHVIDVQLYAGTNAPIDFNGLVRQYYLRQQTHLGEINVNIVDKSERQLGSHDIAKYLREQLKPIADQYDAAIKIVEQPSGPPTLAPLVAEIYGPTAAHRTKLAKQLSAEMLSTPEVVDVDTSIAATHKKLRVTIDHVKAKYFGVTKQQIQMHFGALLDRNPSAYIERTSGLTPLPVVVVASNNFVSDEEVWLNTKMRLPNGQTIVLGEVVEIAEVDAEAPIYHKDLRPVHYVVADMAGETDSPLYGMFAAQEAFETNNPNTNWFYTRAPEHAYTEAIKWDGEWKITYETFRDMGIAYSVGLVLIYLLIVAQFKNYMLPLIIMAPIPLTVIGIFPGHWLLDAKFTAPSMIGMIALAGIIVRNSILLVDFIELQRKEGTNLETAVIMSVQMRARPIILTALAAMIGALFILSDPIFKGLAVSLIFGMAVSSLLTLVVIPIAYYRNAIKKIS